MEVKQGLRRTRVLVEFRRQGNVFRRLPRDVPAWRNLNKNVELNTCVWVPGAGGRVHARTCM
jgi:hypothetical protein